MRKQFASVNMLPATYPLIKGKCYLPDGTHVCHKVAQSCWRCVWDFSQLPNASVWRSISRAIRAVLKSAGHGNEVFDIAEAARAVGSLPEYLELKMAPSFREKLKQVRAGTQVSFHCCRCGALKHNPLSVAIADIDQAFEACTASDVMLAFQHTIKRCHARMGCKAVLVRRGIKCVTQVPPTSYGRGWYLITLEHMAAALQAMSSMTLVTFSSFVLQLKGMAIGGL